MNTTYLSALSRLSSAVPKSISKKPCSAFSIAQELAEFMNEEFRGLAEVSYEINETGQINISVEHLAYFFKLLLKQVNGRNFVSVKISLTAGMFVIDVFYGDNIEFSLSERASLISAAKGAGLDFDFSNGAISLSAKKHATRAMFVYANDTEILKRTIKRIFFGN